MQVVRRGRFGPSSSLRQDDESAQIDNGSPIGSQDTAIKSPNTKKDFPFAPESLSDDALPFISKELVIKRGKKGRSADHTIHDDEHQNSEYWIVINNIVFDCSDFASDHPGGKDIILSFVGEDCSWQFWRLHSKSIMDQYGRGLRIGRTEGIKNRFPEAARYVGLSKLGDDGW